MKNKIYALFIAYCFNSLYAQQTVTKALHFNHNQSELSTQVKDLLDSMVKNLKTKDYAEINITGHTDGDGSNDYNLALSRNRAEAVVQYLKDNGISENKIRMNYLGELNPIASNQNENSKQKNRRVEIIVDYGFTIPEGFTVGYNNFEVNTKKDTTIAIDSKGSKLHIRGNCIVSKDGKAVKGSAKLQYREYTNAAEIAFANIPMTYKDQHEEYYFNSSGMFELRAEANGEDLKVANNTCLTIDYTPVNKNTETAFYRMNDDKSNWQKLQEIKNTNDAESVKEIGKNKPVMVSVKRKKKCPLRGVGDLIVLRDRNILFKDGGAAGVNMNWDTFVMQDNGDRKGATLLAPGMGAGHTYPPIVAGLNIGSFGVYNCDQIMRLPNRVAIRAKYIDAEGNEIQSPHVLSMIDLRYNGAFSFDPASFTCDAKGQTVLALFTSKGQLYMLDNEAFKKMNISSSGAYTFAMQNMTNTIKNTNDLAKYLGIKM